MRLVRSVHGLERVLAWPCRFESVGRGSFRKEDVGTTMRRMSATCTLCRLSRLKGKDE